MTLRQAAKVCYGSAGSDAGAPKSKAPARKPRRFVALREDFDMTVSRRNFARLAVVGSAATVAPPAIAQQPTIKWRLASSFPKTRKNTAGYPVDAYLTSCDLIDLIIGAEGTLGIVTEVIWRLEPIPEGRAAVGFARRAAGEVRFRRQSLHGEGARSEPLARDSAARR